MWCEDAELGERARAALQGTVAVSLDGEPAPDPPPGAVAHVSVEFPEGSGTVYVIGGDSPGAGLRSVLLAESGLPGGLVDVADLDRALGPTVLAVAARQVAVPAAALAAARRPLLTNREKQVLALVVMGLGNREIGGRLHLSESTVKSHLFASYRKLGVNSRGEATRLILDPETGTGLGILEISSAVPQKQDGPATA